MPLTQHYRVYKGGLPHAVFRTDYLQRLRALLLSPGGSDEPSVTGHGSTPTSVRRQRRMSKPTRLFPGSDVNVPILTEQNPAEMVGGISVRLPSARTPSINSPQWFQPGNDFGST